MKNLLFQILLIIIICLFVIFLVYNKRREDIKNNVLDSVEVVTTSGDTVIISGGEYTEIKLKK